MTQYTQKIPKMNKLELSQTIQPKVGFNQLRQQKRHVSYNKNEIYISDIENQLMSKYRCGYSALHKLLVLKEGRNQLTEFYV